ncbi:MAG: protein-export chaperone SecB [Rhodospirillales bacterium]
MTDEVQQALFNIEKIYVKDLSLEVPNSPQIFLERESPHIDIEIQSREQKIDDGIFEVVLTVTATAKLNEKTFFLVEASQAGIFQLRNIPEAEMGPILGIGCLNILFPYVREAISDLVSRAGFPPVLLTPVNFEPIYQAKLERQAAAEPAVPVTH